MYNEFTFCGVGSGFVLLWCLFGAAFVGSRGELDLFFSPHVALLTAF